MIRSHMTGWGAAVQQLSMRGEEDLDQFLYNEIARLLSLPFSPTTPIYTAIHH